LSTIDAIKLLVRHGVMVSSAKLVIENLIDGHFGGAGMIGPDGVNITGRQYHKLDADVPVMIAVSVPDVPDRHVFWQDMEKAGIM
jgi:hypothetical protein